MKGFTMRRRHGLCLLGFLAVLVPLAIPGCQGSPPPPSLAIPKGQRDFVFCHWNVENLFDDKNDGRTGPGDKEYDALYADNSGLLQQKLEKHADAILKMNGGKGPDILRIASACFSSFCCSSPELSA